MNAHIRNIIIGGTLGLLLGVCGISYQTYQFWATIAGAFILQCLILERK